MSSSNSTDNVKQVKEWTEYQKTTFFYQQRSRKKPSSLLGRGIGLMVGGVLIFSLLIIGSILEMAGDVMFAGIGLVALGFFFYGIGMVFKAVFFKKRSVNCPYCGTHHTLVQSARTYVCNNCGHVLRFAGKENDLIKVACPHCKLEWAASPNTGKTICHSCGATATIANGAVQFSMETFVCKFCSAENPVGSYFCWSCGTLLTAPLPIEELESNDISESYSAKPNADGMDAISIRVNTPIGQIFSGINQLNNVIKIANDRPEGSSFHYGLVGSLETALKDIEDALDQKPEYAEVVRGLLALAYPLMASLLKGMNQSAIELVAFDNNNKYWINFSININRLIAKANPGVNLTLEKLQLPKSLVVLKRGNPVGSANPQLYAATIIDEAELQRWVEAHLPAQPIQNLNVPAVILKS